MDILISSTIELLAKVIAENVRQKFRLLTGVEKEVLKIESNLKDIQCVLEDAEEKQIVEKSVRRWIEKLKEVAYDMDDVLDEWNTDWNTTILKLERDGKMEALFVSIIEQLVKVTRENAQQELMLVTGVEKEIKKLECNLKAIQCVLEDAEQKQIAQKSVKFWIERLKEVAYDMDDVLDEWNTAILKLKIEGVESFYVKKKVHCFLSCFAGCRQVVRRHDIATKIKEINEEVDEIAKDRNNHQLTKSSETKQPRRLESTSFVDVSTLHGRDEVKNKIVSTLLGGNNIQTIFIVGMGGIGKTALSQLIFHDDKVRAHFNNVIWVCVSDLFDQNKIARAILEGLDQHSTNLQSSISLEGVLNKIREKIKSAKFLLVLDDVWTEHDENWEPFKAVFQQGMSGSRILVTTRNESVATVMGSSQSQVFNLKELSDEVCWVILSQVAFVGRDNDLRENLEDIGREIAKKCKGLPLAAKTLGGLLRYKKTRDEWQNIKNSEIWKLNVAEEDIFKPLLLSYYDLPSQIRPCLLYCAIFPKDFVFRRPELIKHWMAHGYLGIEEKNGEEYFNYLASRCFFQDFVKYGDANVSHCKMHDIIHDFVQYLTKEEIVAVEVDSCDNLSLGSSFKKARHLRVTIAKENQFPVSINGIEKLRSLVTNGKECTLTGEALQALFKGAKCLRLLEFTMDYLNDTIVWVKNDTSVWVKEIPNGIGKLIHLRYLNFSCNRLLKELPEGVCELHNLQYLDLSFCGHLKKLPEGIGKLINLRSLDTRSCYRLEYYPKGISRLTYLRELPYVEAKVDGNDDKEFSVGDLENLDLLRGFLQIRVVGNKVDEEDAKRAKLHNKTHLKELHIFKLDEVVNVDDVIQSLNPPDWLNIERFGWKSYGY